MLFIEVVAESGFSISCSTCLFVLNKKNELFLCLRTSKMLSLGVFDRYESY